MNAVVVPFRIVRRNSSRVHPEILNRWRFLTASEKRGIVNIVRFFSGDRDRPVRNIGKPVITIDRDDKGAA